MNNPLINYIDTEFDTSGYGIDKFDENESFPSNRFIFMIYNNAKIDALTGTFNPYVKNIYQYIAHQDSKEEFYITAIDNLIKKNDYLQLTFQFDQDFISESEFDEELEKNQEKYLITMNPDFREDQFKIISDIIPKLKRNFTGDEIAELFSIPIENVNSYIDSLKIRNEIL